MDHGVAEWLTSGSLGNISCVQLQKAAPQLWRCNVPLLYKLPNHQLRHVISFAWPSLALNTASRGGLGMRLCMFIYQQLRDFKKGTWEGVLDNPPRRIACSNRKTFLSSSIWQLSFNLTELLRGTFNSLHKLKTIFQYACHIHDVFVTWYWLVQLLGIHKCSYILAFLLPWIWLLVM